MDRKYLDSEEGPNHGGHRMCETHWQQRGLAGRQTQFLWRKKWRRRWLKMRQTKHEKQEDARYVIERNPLKLNISHENGTTTLYLQHGCCLLHIDRCEVRAGQRHLQVHTVMRVVLLLFYEYKEIRQSGNKNWTNELTTETTKSESRLQKNMACGEQPPQSVKSSKCLTCSRKPW